MNYRNILYNKRKGYIGYITLNRPEAANAINRVMADDLQRVVREIRDDDNRPRVFVLTGASNVFSTGEPSTDSESAQASSVASTAIAGLKAPVIAAINGDALGSGLDLALSADIRLSVESARFGFPEVSHGHIPSGGGTQRLPRIVGRGKALEMILTAEVIDADEAYRVGLINRIIASADLMNAAERLAQKLASKGPIAEQYAKEAISKGMDMTLGQGLGLEADLSFILQSTKDRAEGISAFLQKRSPEFKGE